MIAACENNRIITIVLVLVITIGCVLSDGVPQYNKSEHDINIKSIKRRNINFYSSIKSRSRNKCTPASNCFFVPVCGRGENGLDNLSSSVDNLLLYNSTKLTLYKGSITHEDYYFYVPRDCMKRNDNIYSVIKTVPVKYIEFFSDGRIYSTTGHVIDNNSYCLDPVQKDPDDVIICTWNPFSSYEWKVLHIFCWSTVIPIPFFLVAFIIHASSSRAKPAYRMMQCGYCASSMVFFILLSIPMVSFVLWIDGHSKYSYRGLDNAFLNPSVKLMFRIIMFVGTLPYLHVNVMSFDIWWTFRQSLPPQKRDKHSELIRIFIYSIYIWGVSIIINYNANVEEDLRYHIIVLVLIGCNSVFFIATVWRIVKVRREIANHLGRQKHNNNKKYLMLYFKLYILTGMNLVEFINLNIISLIDENLEGEIIVLIILFILKGPTIFMCFIWKDKATYAFWAKLKEVIYKFISCSSCKQRPEV